MIDNDSYIIEGDIIKQLYFEWLVGIVGETPTRQTFSKLCRELNAVIFFDKIDKDINRIKEALRLREDFIDNFYQRNQDIYNIEDILSGPTTVLEVIVALAVKIENDFMYDPIYGDQTSRWFQEMINNLGFGSFDDTVNFEPSIRNYIRTVLLIFVNREYKRDGNGGLFPLKMAKDDQRRIEIWKQLLAYLNENYFNFDEN